MAIENRIQLRHGSTVPKNGDLLPWELGVYGDRLFIGLNQLDSNGNTVVTEITFEDGGETTTGGVGQAGTGKYAEIFNDIAKNVASGDYSHTEGRVTKASGESAHAQGWNTVAAGYASHAEGGGTVANGKYTHVQGKWNIADEVPENNNDFSKYAHMVGNGTSQTPSNAHTLDWAGNAWFAGKVYTGGTSQDDPNATTLVTQTELAKTKENVDAAIKAIDFFNVGTPIKANDDLNDYTDVGKYYVATADDAETIKNAPIDNGNYALYVFRRTGGPISQLLLSINGDICIRSANNTGVWGDWSTKANQSTVTAIREAVSTLQTKVNNLITGQTVDNELIDIRLRWDGLKTYDSAGDAVRAQIKESLNFKGVLDSGSKLSDIRQTGIYRWFSSNTKGIPVDVPDGGSFSQFAIMAVLQSPEYNGVNGHTLQIVTNDYGETAIRYGYANGWGVWNYNYRPIDPNSVRSGGFMNKAKRGWTPIRSTIPKNTTKGEVTYYTAGEEVIGLPYGSNYHLGNDILLNRNLSTFYSAVENPGSILYNKTGGRQKTVAPAYGEVCSSFTGAFCGQKSYKTTYELNALDKNENFTQVKFIDYHSPEQLRIGQVLLNDPDPLPSGADPFNHVKVITGIFVDDTLAVKRIEVSEAVGTRVTTKKLTVEQFESVLNGTYKNSNGQIEDTKYNLVEYFDFEIPILPKIQYATDCIPEYGDKTYYQIDEPIWLYLETAKVGSNLYISRKETKWLLQDVWVKQLLEEEDLSKDVKDNFKGYVQHKIAEKYQDGTERFKTITYDDGDKKGSYNIYSITTIFSSDSDTNAASGLANQLQLLIDGIKSLNSDLQWKYRSLQPKLESRLEQLKATKYTTWYVTTDPTQETWCTIEIIDKGEVQVSGTTVTAANYSDNITPLYYEVIYFYKKEGSTPIYPVPKINNQALEGEYESNVIGNSQTFFNADSATGQFTRPTKNTNRENEGFYLRVFFDTPFGITFEDSGGIML